MAGRAPMKLYQYDAAGKYIKTWNSQSELRAVYFPQTQFTGKYPLFQHGRPFRKLIDDTWITPIAGRDNLLNAIRRDADPYLKIAPTKAQKNKIVQLINADKVVIAEFASPSIAALVMKIDLGELYSRADRKRYKLIEYPHSGFHIIIKEKECKD